jgi:hypothetical protein
VAGTGPQCKWKDGSASNSDPQPQTLNPKPQTPPRCGRSGSQTSTQPPTQGWTRDDFLVPVTGMIGQFSTSHGHDWSRISSYNLRFVTCGRCGRSGSQTSTQPPSSGSTTGRPTSASPSFTRTRLPSRPSIRTCPIYYCRTGPVRVLKGLYSPVL